MTSLEQFNHLLQLAKVRLSITALPEGKLIWNLWDCSNPDSPVLIDENKNKYNYSAEFGITNKSLSEGK